MGDTERRSDDQARSNPVGRLRRTINDLPKTLFPLLPGPAQIVASILATATTFAVALTWYGINLENGTGLAVFTAVMLTAFTVASASFPRVVSSWLNRNHWFPTGDGVGPIFAMIASYAPLIIFSVAHVSIAAQHHRTYSGVSAVGLLGAILWGIHEALKAKKEYDLLDIPKKLTPPTG